jgi:pimeloyl-ACP methyl ester carboxylesterase
MEIREFTFNTGAVVLNYASAHGPGRPLMLLHGGNARWQSFETIISELAATWHLYAPDFRGQGKSGWVPGSYRLQDYVDDTIAFLRHQVREPACLFGHSLGGIVALMTAAQYPEGVCAVAVGDAPLSSRTWREHLVQSRDRIATWRDLCGGQKPLEQVIETLKDAPFEAPGQREPLPMRAVMGEENPVYAWLAANLIRSDPDTISALLERYDDTAAGYEMGRVLPAVRCPVLLLQADPAAGGLMTDGEIAQALPQLDRPSHVRLAGTGHALQIVHPEPVVTALNAFFESFAGASQVNHPDV